MPKQSIYGLLGPNGAGKTTLIRMLNQITAPDEGEIIFNGEKLNRSHNSQIGYLPEERGLYKSMKVGEQAIYLAQLKGVSNFPRMFLNTFFVATCSCIVSTFFVLAVSYCLSRVKWKMRKPYMNTAMVITLFPGFMSMIAVYFILKALGMTEGDKIYLSLIICFSSGADAPKQLPSGPAL